MWYRQLLSVILGITLAGALGGWVGAQLQQPQYTATAFVVVYRMPAGQTDLITPDEASSLQSVYEAGIFQETLIARSLPYFPGLTAADFRRDVQIAIVAYSPYTRVIVTRPDPRQAVALANNVSDTWSGLSQQLYEDTFHELRQRLQGQELDLQSQVATLQASVTAQTSAQPQNPALAQALQTRLAAAQGQESDLASSLAALTNYHDKGEGLAYTAVRANLRNVTVKPQVFRVTALGMAIGCIAGVLVALWGVRQRGWAWLRGTPDAPSSISPAGGWR